MKANHIKKEEQIRSELLKQRGERLGEVMEMLNYHSLDDIGTALKGDGQPFDRSTISKYLSGQLDISKRALLELTSTFHVSKEWLLYGVGEMFSIPVKNTPSNNIKNKLKNDNKGLQSNKILIDLFPQLFENEQIAQIVQLLPLPANTNGWIKHISPGEQLQTQPLNVSSMLYTGIQNGDTMNINPDEYYRIPNLQADRMITVAEKNMNGRINKGDKATVRWVDKKDVRFGHIYYIVHVNGDKTINYIRKGTQGNWLLKNENTKDFDDYEVAISDIVAIYKIGINIGMNEQIELSA